MARKKFTKRSKRKGKYKSLLEASIAKTLPKNARYETERINYVLPKKYIPDFVVKTKDGRLIYLEVKGYLRYEDQAKMRSVKHSNPDIDIRLVFGADSKVQGSKMTNSQWCEKYNFPFCIGAPPKHWFG